MATRKPATKKPAKPAAFTVGQLYDCRLLCAALVAGVCRWEPFHDGLRGEICVNGIRHCTNLDETGVPLLSQNARVALLDALTRTRHAEGRTFPSPERLTP